MNSACIFNNLDERHKLPKHTRKIGTVNTLLNVLKLLNVKSIKVLNLLNKQINN